MIPRSKRNLALAAYCEHDKTTYYMPDKSRTSSTRSSHWGGDAKFDLLEGKDHFGTCDSAFSRERLAWIFGHSSSGVEPVADNVDDGNATVEARYDLSGRRVADGYQGIQIVRMTDGSVRKVANPKP